MHQTTSWIKQTLKIKHFLGTSENAVRIQIAVALIAFLLLRLAYAAQTFLAAWDGGVEPNTNKGPSGPLWSIGVWAISERQIVVVDLDGIDWCRLTLLAHQVLQVDLVDGPDPVTQVVDQFEDGERRFGRPGCRDRERDGLRQSGGMGCIGVMGITVFDTSVTASPAFRCVAFGHHFFPRRCLVRCSVRSRASLTR